MNKDEAMKLEQLKSLCDAATLGPVQTITRDMASLEVHKPYVGTYAACPADSGLYSNHAANMQLVAAAINALPSLLKLWEAAKELSDYIEDDGTGPYFARPSDAHGVLYRMNKALSELEAI